MKLKIIVLSVSILMIVSCEFKSYHPLLSNVGKNKKELQKVFDYYSSPEDSLKFKAAEFLIKNMNSHYSLELREQEKVDAFFKKFGKQFYIPKDSVPKTNRRLRKEIGDLIISNGFENGNLPASSYKKYLDIETINADFLIENIEYAFKAWEFPWARKYSFEHFCKYILPYRYGNEPLELWRKDIFEKYKWVADSLENASIIEVAELINKQFQSDFYTSKKLGKNGMRLKISNQLDGGIFVDCFDQAGLGVCVLRSLGIPSTVARITKWGNRNNGHDMTAMLKLDGNWKPFNFGGTKFHKYSVDGLRVSAPKMFFRDFDGVKDASSKLLNTVDLEVKISTENNSNVYLCVFDNLRWVSLVKGENLNSKAIFKNVGRDIEVMYLAAIKTKGKLEPVSPVFISDSVGNITYFEPNKTKKISATLNRKYSGLDKKESRLSNLIGGEFFISNNKDFSNKRSLFRIDTLLEYRNNLIKIPNQKGTYVKYEFPPSDGSSVMDGPAEIAFYTTEGETIKQLNGNYFGSSQLSKKHINIMTDGDFLNYVRALNYKKDIAIETGKLILRKNENPIWIGLELNSETTITHVSICPRNDQNGIYPGMNYELFYWDNGWTSLGKKKATSYTITFDEIPENALLWLRNLDEGKEERIFIIEDGKQKWY